MTIISSGQLTLTDLNDTKQLILYLNPNFRTQVYDANQASTVDTAYSPNFTSSNLVITPELYVAGGSGANLLPTASVKSLTWYEGSQTTTALAETATTGTSTAGYTYNIPNGTLATTAKPLTIKSNIKSANTQMYTCQVVYTDPDTGFDITLKAQFEVAKITNGLKGDVGTNALTAVLSNESVTLASDNSGGSVSYTSAGTDIFVYDGATALTYDGVGTANGKFTVSASATNITANAPTGSGTTKATYTVTNMTQDTASITYTITGKTLAGASISITKIQSFAKSKTGSAGTTPTSYWLVPNTNVIQKTVGNVLTPASISVDMKSQTGTGTPAFYGGRLIIAESTDGSTFTDKYTSASNETVAKAYTPSSSSVKIIRIRMYLAGGTATLLDEEQVVVVSDGATGIDSYYLNVWTPNGDTIRNGVGTLTAQADLYKGAGTVTPTAYKWYVQDPIATTASGGDADGGNGWRLINGVSDATTAPTLALSANTATRMSVATYYVKYTWLGLSGETMASAEASLAVTANNDLKVTVPAFPSGVYGAKVYVGTATGANKFQGVITTSAGNMVISSFDATGNTTPTSTTASTAQVTGATLTIVPQAIAGVEGYKCVATAPTIGTKYSGLTVVKDFQDPVSVNILGANVLKNGQGSTTLTAQLIQNGSEIPTAGYTFVWALYNQNGTLNKTLTGSGDTITISASDFNGVNNLVVDVSK